MGFPCLVNENQLIHRSSDHSGFILCGCRGSRRPDAETVPVGIDSAGGVALEKLRFGGKA